MNKLKNEKSPYLLQHADNPIDWYPWGDEAFEVARRTKRPLFVSIGYSTCHWCHVMARESFQDLEVADLLNRHFVSVKVDREESPVVDQCLMEVCQALTQGGGWPLSIFLTPDGFPFFAGTYFPKLGLGGRPGFMDILRELNKLWRTKGEKIEAGGKALVEALNQSYLERRKRHSPQYEELVERAFNGLKKAFDPKWGGFGEAPKFPSVPFLLFLFSYHKDNGDKAALYMGTHTLEKMREGGIWDHLSGGFHRYSVDAKWLVPHFEKMLYDQALLMIAYVMGFEITRKDFFLKTATEIADYVLMVLRHSEGGFFTAEDADSEGQEGSFYVWTKGQVLEVLGKDSGELFCKIYGVTDSGNFEDGKNVLYLSQPISKAYEKLGFEDERALKRFLSWAFKRLLKARDRRPRPFMDDKVLTSWNGLAIKGFSMLYKASGERRYLHAALNAADFLMDQMIGDSQVFRRFRDGEVRHLGALDDYANLAWGLLEIGKAAGNEKYVREAQGIIESALSMFYDNCKHMFFYAPLAQSPTPILPIPPLDSAMPSPVSVIVACLLDLFQITKVSNYLNEAENILIQERRGLQDRLFGNTHLLSQFLRFKRAVSDGEL